MFLSEQRTRRIVAIIIAITSVTLIAGPIVSASFPSTQGGNKHEASTFQSQASIIHENELLNQEAYKQIDFMLLQVSLEKKEEIRLQKEKQVREKKRQAKLKKQEELKLLQLEKEKQALASNGERYIYYEVMDTDGTWFMLDYDLQEYLYELCIKYDVEESYRLFICQFFTESRYRSIISKTNDYGIAQINKCNHKWLREELGITDFLDEKQSMLCGVHMMSDYLKQYSKEEALGKYNTGDVCVNNYARKIMNIYNSDTRVREIKKEEA